MNAASAPTAARLAEEFATTFGYSPQACFRAPGRVNLIGEHTDYNNGLVLPIAIDRAVHVAIGRRPQDRRVDEEQDRPATAAPPRSPQSIRIVSDHRDDSGERLSGQFTAAELVPGQMRGWLSHPAGVVDEIAKTTGTMVGGVDLYVESTVPVGAGLSSSHALEVAVLIALDEVFDLGLNDREKVLLTQRAENDFVGAPTGIVDQAASIMTEAGHALFLDCRDLRTRQIPFDLDAEGLRLLVSSAWPRRTCSCWSSTPGCPTPTAKAATVTGGAAVRKPPGSSASRVCVSSTKQSTSVRSPMSSGNGYGTCSTRTLASGPPSTIWKAPAVRRATGSGGSVSSSWPRMLRSPRTMRSRVPNSTPPSKRRWRPGRSGHG